jgi:ABC-type branched-subunit amino acid transport system substrate-binding protein
MILRDCLRTTLFGLMGLLAIPIANAAATQIGVIVPESWPDKAQAEEIRNGMLLALKTWPGQPAPTLVIKDSACDATKAAAAARALIDAKVDVVIGGWCMLGSVPKILRDAGVPFVSTNSERLASGSDTSLQFGVVPMNLADSIASKLRTDAGLRVTATSACWIDYEQKLSDKYDAALCPTLHVDSTRWNEIAPTYTAAYRKPFTIAAARGHAAMQVALATIKQLRAGSRPATVLRDVKEVNTVLGRVRYRDDAVPDDAMQLILSAHMPRLPAREAAVLDEVMKSKGCGCAKSGECPQSKTWSSMPFVVQCAKPK